MKKQFESIIPSKLPEDLREAYDLIKSISDDFTDFSNDDLAENAKVVLSTIQKKFPQAIKGEKASKPSTPKPARPAKPSTPKPARPTRPKAVGSKNEKIQKEIADINREIKDIIAKLNEQDKIKMRVARELDDYMKSNGLGRTQQEAELIKAKQKLKLYRQFLKTDIAKFKRLRKSASSGSIGMSNSKPKAKKTTSSSSKKDSSSTKKSSSTKASSSTKKRSSSSSSLKPITISSLKPRSSSKKRAASKSSLVSRPVSRVSSISKSKSKKRTTLVDRLEKALFPNKPKFNK